jgi:secreted trypsin-like serine protease
MNVRFSERVGALTVLMALSVGASVGPSFGAVPAVVGGQDSTFSAQPWQVLFIIDEESVCSGSLVSSDQIVSAAHCFANQDQSKVQAWTGITSMSERSPSTQLSIKSIVVHPDFDPVTFANDIALVSLSRPVPADLGALSIGLPVNQDPAQWPAAGSTAEIAGWGETNPDVPVASDVLQSATVSIIEGPDSAVCGNYGNSYLPSMQICAGIDVGGVDACQGDSGGALSVNLAGEPILAGISSTGFECSRAGYPGLYVRVTTYLPWLAELGVDLDFGGGTAWVDGVGSDKDGVPAPFRLGGSYTKAAFAELAGLPAKTARARVIRGDACVQQGSDIRFVRAGKCTVTVATPRKRVPMIISVYG